MACRICNSMETFCSSQSINFVLLFFGSNKCAQDEQMNECYVTRCNLTKFCIKIKAKTHIAVLHGKL